MGVVYDAEDVRLPRRVALKFLPDELADNPDATRRLAPRSADHRAAEPLRTSAPSTKSTSTRDGCSSPWSASRARTSRPTWPGRPSTPREIVDIALQITQALEAAHAKGIVHRDIKPGNIFISDGGQVKVLDFGLARQLPDVDETASGDWKDRRFPGVRSGRPATWRLSGSCRCRSMRGAICSRWAW